MKITNYVTCTCKLQTKSKNYKLTQSPTTNYKQLRVLSSRSLPNYTRGKSEPKFSHYRQPYQPISVDWFKNLLKNFFAPIAAPDQAKSRHKESSDKSAANKQNTKTAPATKGATPFPQARIGVPRARNQNALQAVQLMSVVDKRTSSVVKPTRCGYLQYGPPHISSQYCSELNNHLSDLLKTHYDAIDFL